jgi:XTP/dITP diphosphohydrolase
MIEPPRHDAAQAGIPLERSVDAALRRVVLASNNAGKLREFSALEALDIELVAQGQLGVQEAEEPHATFVENALAKARHASAATGLPALADDSGLCVRALHGAPGVHSARFAQRHGGEKSDAANNACLLDALRAHADRRGYYYCVLALVRYPDDPEPLLVDGRWHGDVLAEPRGAHGFGYDPLFYIPALCASVAELDPAIKRVHSHRALALRKLVERLTENA